MELFTYIQYLFFKQWLKRRPRALFATFLFFFGGGLGIALELTLFNALIVGLLGIPGVLLLLAIHFLL